MAGKGIVAPWECKAISEVTVDKPGTWNPSNEPNKKFKYVDISSVDNKKKKIVEAKELLGSEAPSRARKIMRAGDVIVSTTRPNLNAVAVVTKVFDNEICSTGYCVLRPTERVFTDYLFYFVQSYHFVSLLSGEVSGAMYPATTDAKIRAVKLPVPPIQEQQRIIDILKRADGIRRLRKQAQDTARQLIPALFIDMFGDPTTNPKGWPVRKVSELVKRFEGGKNIQAGSENGSPYRILKVSAVTSGVYRESESKPAPDGYSPPGKHIVKVGDMLFSRANTEELVGATAIVEKTDGKTLLPDKLWRFIWTEPVAPAYMHALFQSSHARRELGKLSTGTSASMRNISQGKLFELSLPVAPYAVQKEFADRVTEIHSAGSKQSTATAKTEATFQSLLHRAFNGGV